MKRNNIKWKNIYHMLCYAIREMQYLEVGDSTFEHVNTSTELMGRLLVLALDEVHKLERKYNSEEKSTTRPKGRINIRKSIETSSYANGKLVCKYYTLDENSEANQLLKFAVRALTTPDQMSQGISADTISSLEGHRDKMLNVHDVSLSSLSHRRNIGSNLPVQYKPALVLSNMIIDLLLISDADEEELAFKFIDGKRLRYLFEEFVRNFYSMEYTRARTSRPSFNIRGGGRAQPDILLSSGDSELVVDTKWYETTAATVANENQALSYGIAVRETREKRPSISALILYAEASAWHKESVQIRDHETSGIITIHTESLNLNKSFSEIKRRLISLADMCFDAQLKHSDN